METIGYFKAIQGGIGVNSKVEATIRETQRRLSFDLMNSVNLVADATRNGVQQKFVVTPCAESYKYNVIAFPGEELFTGDLLEFKGRHWMVVEMPSAPVMQFSGVVWECNHLFKFQTFDGTIVERWGVIDSGQYSTDVYNGTMLTDTNSQYRLYMQYDEETKQIFIDKRLAIATIFDQNGKEILDVYKVTDVDPVTQSYGGGHLLALRAVSDAYDPLKDSVSRMICDYTDPADHPGDGEQSSAIIGDNIIRAGFSRKYVFDTPQVDNSKIVNSVFSWSIECQSNGVHMTQNGNESVVYVDRNTPPGTAILIRASYGDASSVAYQAEKMVKVVGVLE